MQDDRGRHARETLVDTPESRCEKMAKLELEDLMKFSTSANRVAGRRALGVVRGW